MSELREVDVRQDAIATSEAARADLFFTQVSDEALEAAAGNLAMLEPTPTMWTSSCYASCCQR